MDARAWRERLVEGLLANPVWQPEDEATEAMLADPAACCSFAELGLDSIARLEFCIWLDTEAGVQVTEATLIAHPDLRALAAHLAGRAA